MVPTLSLDDQVTKLAEQLTVEFSGKLPDSVVRGLVNDVYGEMSSAKVTQFVPVLINRSVRARIRAQVPQVA